MMDNDDLYLFPFEYPTSLNRRLILLEWFFFFIVLSRSLHKTFIIIHYDFGIKNNIHIQDRTDVFISVKSIFVGSIRVPL